MTDSSIENLRQAVINDYAFLCADDGGTTHDEVSLEEFKKSAADMSWDELIQESWCMSDSAEEVQKYIDKWLPLGAFAALTYIKNPDGSTTLQTDL